MKIEELNDDQKAYLVTDQTKIWESCPKYDGTLWLYGIKFPFQLLLIHKLKNQKEYKDIKAAAREFLIPRGILEKNWKSLGEEILSSIKDTELAKFMDGSSERDFYIPYLNPVKEIIKPSDLVLSDFFEPEQGEYMPIGAAAERLKYCTNTYGYLELGLAEALIKTKREVMLTCVNVILPKELYPWS